MSIEVLCYFCQSFSDLYKKCSLNTHMCTDWPYFLNRAFLCILSLSLSHLRILHEPKLSIKLVSLFLYSISNTCFRTLLFTLSPKPLLQSSEVKVGALHRINVCSGIELLVVGVSLLLCLPVFLRAVVSRPLVVLPDSSLPSMITLSMSQLWFP